MVAPNPTKKSVSDIKSALLRPALTSHFLVYIKPPEGTFINKYLQQNGLTFNPLKQNNLILMCSDATLPGSSFLTHENNNDFAGVTERFAYRRAYDDRIDLSFYIDAEEYYSIRFFEIWMKYIADESISGGSKIPEYFYRFRYPDGDNGYRNNSALTITKFERDYKSANLKYEFIKPYPISIQSIPISYDSSSLLKCTVSMTYIRYVVTSDRGMSEKEPGGQSTANGVPDNLTPEQQAGYNQAFFNNSSLNQFNISSGSLTNIFGEGEEIINAINSIQTSVESGLPYVGRNVGPLAP
jgi:hypothetical protein